MPAPFLAASLVTLRSEVNNRWPERSKVSDGWLGDTAHQARVSDHNPDANGCVHAIDVTAAGIDPMWLVRLLIADDHKRVRYVIFNRKIYQRDRGWVARDYTGSNPHTHHVHVSIEHTVHAETDTHEWMDDMPSADDVADAVWNRDLVPDGEDPKNPTWRAKNSLARVKARVEEIYTLVKEIHAAVTKKA
jgi:hypothetical protein